MRSILITLSLVLLMSACGREQPAPVAAPPPAPTPAQQPQGQLPPGAGPGLAGMPPGQFPQGQFPPGFDPNSPQFAGGQGWANDGYYYDFDPYFYDGGYVGDYGYYGGGWGGVGVDIRGPRGGGFSFYTGG